MPTIRYAALLGVVFLAACGGEKKDAHHGGDSHAAESVVVTPGAGMPTKAEIAALFDEWNRTLQTGSEHDMAMLYAEDGVLLPTVSNQARSNRPEIADYFVHFQQKHPKGTINEQYIDVLDANTAVNSGIYTFDLMVDGAPSHVVARYSYLYEKIGGKWLIKSHHSSAMPEPVAQRPPALAEALELRPTTEVAANSGGHGGDSHGGGHGGSHGGGGGH